MSMTAQISQRAFATKAGEASGTEGRPLKSFLLLALGIGLSLLTIPLIIDVPMSPFLMGMVFIALLAPALIMTRRADGPAAMRQLLKRTLIWRFSPLRWAITLVGVPALTIAIGALSGTFSAPQDGWTSVLTTYLFNAFIVGALILNVWEESAWGGFFQSRMMARRGLIAGALITSIPFVVIHIPLQFEGDWTWSSAATNVAVLFLVTPFYRLLVGEHLLATGGSILAIGLLHASWNEAAKFDFVDGDWQVVTAVALLALGLVAKRRLSTRSPAEQDTVEDEREEAASWIAPAKAATVPSA
jgi:membrane protease YdiL (CAAX protease family)